MNIHCNLLIKNEIDIIEQCLLAAVKWSDYIYVFDNGSSDGTWEKVHELSKDYKQIIPFKQDDCLYHNGLRGYIYNHFKDNGKLGDWWCKFDADEFYIDNPRVFLAKVPEKYRSVYSASFQYYFTDKDLELYEKKPELYGDDQPVENKCRYYINNWSELRFVRQHKNMKWSDNDVWPLKIYPAYPVRIWLKHFQYRSPQHIEKRMANRQKAIDKGTGFKHETHSNWLNRTVLKLSKVKTKSIRKLPESWKERIVDASFLNYDNHDNKLVYNEKKLPKLRTNIVLSFLGNLKIKLKKIL